MRLFVALWPPKPLLEALQNLSRHLRHRAGPTPLRLTRPEHWHVTLRFLGEVDDARVTDGTLDRALKEAVAGIGPFTLHLAAPGCFPALGRPRVFWVGLEGGTKSLASLQERIVRSTDPFVGTPEREGFHPHLTLARAGDREPRRRGFDREPGSCGSRREDAPEGGGQGRPEPGIRPEGRSLRETWEGLSPPPCPPWEVQEVHLVRSVLEPGGPAYSRIGGYRLDAPTPPS